MKSRGLKDFRKEQELQNALLQYQLYEAVMNDMMKQAITAMIAVCEKRRYKKPYIQRFFNDIVMVLEMPEFRNWSTTFKVKYNANGEFSLSNIINIINAGGTICGVGEWRPERDGQFGMFHVKAD